MEKKLKYAWWAVLAVLLLIAAGKFFLPGGSGAYLEKTVSSREIVVYVSGAVEKQGLIHLPADARLNDALLQARLLPEANVDYLNPAEKLKDGQKIIVPYRIEHNPDDTPGQSQVYAADAAAGTMSANTGVTGEGRININTAGTAELNRLNGVGPVLAQRIVQYRTENGPFSRPEDLKKVSGIGEKIFEKMADQVTVGP